MFTQIITFFIIVAIIGCIMYGRKLIRTEKVDAVFGNPERAKGGTHWIIVGSSVILLTWLYYSWDIAKSFYPQSANELCQVGKVNDSLLSLKYLFPIEEREFKSTSIIKAENKNIAKLKNEIQNSKEISEQHRSFLIGLIDKTKSTIPLLTNESLLENQTKIKISELADKIDQLSNEFQKKDYPYENSEQRNKRLIDAQAEGGWGASGTAVENTVEVPTIPKTNKGLKFDAAAQELKIISDEFFKLRNHNFKYKSAMKVIKDDVKAFRSAADASEEVASTLAKDILKIARRIEYASIFPPNTLNGMQKSILTFDEVQKDEQGSLRLVDIFLFPAGTIVSSGPNCSEQGSGRWLPKPSDTLNKFILLSKPSVGFKNIPLLWFEWMDVSKIFGFILPDWIADIIPGKYPVHNEFGVVEPNFKSKVLSVVTGEFKLFKIPIPMGHIWDSFLRVLLGLNIIDWIAFSLTISLQVLLFSKSHKFNKSIITFSAITVYSGMLLFFLTVLLYDLQFVSQSFVDIFSFEKIFLVTNIPPLIAVAGTIFAYFSIVILNFGDFSRYVNNEKELKKGNLSLIANLIIFSFFALFIVIGADIFLNKNLENMERILTNPTDIVGKINNIQITVITLFFIVFASASTNLVANYIPAQNSLLNFLPNKLNLKSSAFIIFFFGFIIGIFWLTLLSQIGILSFVDTFSSFFGPMFGIIVVDYYFIKESNLNNKDFFSNEKEGAYFYSNGWHIKAIYSLILGFIFASSTIWNESLMSFNSYSWVIGAFISSLTYYLLASK